MTERNRGHPVTPKTGRLPWIPVTTRSHPEWHTETHPGTILIPLISSLRPQLMLCNTGLFSFLKD